MFSYEIHTASLRDIVLLAPAYRTYPTGRKFICTLGCNYYVIDTSVAEAANSEKAGAGYESISNKSGTGLLE